MVIPSHPLLYLCTDPGIPVFGHKGASTHVREMARAMASLGQAVRLAVSGPVGDVPKGFPCEIIRLAAPRGRAWRWLGFDGRRMLGEWLAWRRLDALIRQNPPAFIYERYSLYGWAGARLARRHALGRVLEVNALLSEESATRLHFPARARALERRVLGGAPAIAAISSVMKSRLIEELGIPADRIFISPMGIDPARFRPGIDPAPALEKLGIRKDISERPFVIGYVGSFNHYHRPGWLLDLAHALRERSVPFRLAVIGGPRAKVERHRAEARRRGVETVFDYLGEVAHDQLPGWLAAFDLAVVPGAAPQSSPTKIVEAAAMGIPQVTPDTAPIRVLLEGIADEAFFPIEAREAFIERVLESLIRLDLRRREALEHACLAARRHSWESRAAEALEFLQRQPRRQAPPR